MAIFSEGISEGMGYAAGMSFPLYIVIALPISVVLFNKTKSKKVKLLILLANLFYFIIFNVSMIAWVSI